MTAPLAVRALDLWGCLKIVRRCYPDTTWPDMHHARDALDGLRTDPHPLIRAMAAEWLGQRASTGDAA